MVFKNLIMKKYLYILIFIPFLTFSQGINLELNQVLLLDIYNSGTYSTYVVPEGKVWKVTSALITCSSNCASSISINGSSVIFHTFTSSMPGTGGQSNGAGQMTNLPIWLPEGTIVGYGSGVGQLSILEFNAQ